MPAMNHAINGLFANHTLRKLFYRSRYLLAILLIVPLARFMKPELLPLGLGISLFGQAIQTWCFAALVKNRELTIRGPYVIVRNPMYLGRYFLLLGFVILPGNWIIATVFTVLYIPYMTNRVRREEVRLRRNFGEDYAKYCRATWSFVPTLSRLFDSRVRFFDWGPFLENNAHWNILLTLLAYAALFAAPRFF